MKNSLHKDYYEHSVFKQLDQYSKFYKDLSGLIINYLTQGTRSIVNIDSYVLSSIQGTIESIHDVLLKGRINDSYALLRKYYDSTIINIYTNLYLSTNFGLNNIIVEPINNWVQGIDKIPSFEVMSKYIISSKKTMEITQLIYANGKFKESTFEDLRKKCNEHTHYLYFKNLLDNDDELFSQNRIVTLDSFSNDIKNLFILHFSYLFYINDHYMRTSDYIDSLDCGETPDEESLYWVVQFVQDIFDSVIKKNRPDIAAVIKSKTTMKLQ